MNNFNEIQAPNYSDNEIVEMNSEHDPSWSFEKIRPGDMERNPVSDEFFANNTQLEAIVRESIQNSLDACADTNQPVRVRIYFSGDDKLSADKFLRYRNGGDRFNDPKNGLRTPIPSTQDDCQFVVIEDFNTTGLTGDVMEKPANEDVEHRNDWNYYNYFFRENGSTKIGANTLGSWGAGKCVFQRASRLKTSFAFSIREGYKYNKFVVGKATLQNHTDANRITWAPDGWFGFRDEPDPNSTKMFKRPITDDDFIKTFISDFNLKRATQIGTSIVIPYVVVDEKEVESAEFSLNNIVKAIIQNFLVAIYDNRLIVNVQIGEDGEEITVDKASLQSFKSYLPKLEDKDPLVTEKHLELILDTLNGDFPDSQKFNLNSPGERAIWRSEMFKEGQLQSIKELLNVKKSCLISVPMPIRKKNREICEANFKVIIKKVRTNRGLSPVFYRSGLLIDSVGKRPLNDYIAMVVVEGGNLADLLVASEPPSHNQWSYGAERVIKEYDAPKTHIDFVTTAPRKILDYLAQFDREANWDALSDVFGIKRQSTDDDNRDGIVPSSSSEGKDAGEDLSIAERLKIISFSLINGNDTGVKIKNGSGLEKLDDNKLPIKVKFKIGYDTFKGLSWSPNDFDLGKDDIVKLKCEEGSAKISGDNNVVILEILDKHQFSVSITGFDKNRDITVANVRYIYAKEDENAAEV